MNATPVIAIFDIGRTHKKFMLFDEDYHVVEETAVAIPDITDDDGDGCEDLKRIAAWMLAQVHAAIVDPAYEIRAVNFSAHGASFVHLDSAGNTVTPLYDYMKPLEETVTENFYQLFGGKRRFSLATGSPAVNMLNSGLQLYWLKHEKPDCFAHIQTSLHLPQYGNYLFSQKKHADISSIGCHTGLWDFEKGNYHEWLRKEGIVRVLPVAEKTTVFDVVKLGDKNLPVGIGVHDSSAALMPFVYTADQPFLLLSSGTWNITLNPFFDGSLHEKDYARDCLYYLLDINRKVAASRLFLGNEYHHQVEKLEDYFQKKEGYHMEVHPDEYLFNKVLEEQTFSKVFFPETMTGTGPFPNLKTASPDLSQFASFEEAYHKMMFDLTYLQKVSIELSRQKMPINRLYVSGGFVQSKVFMELLQAFLPDWAIFMAENKRSSALGAAVVLHDVWQKEPLTESVTPIVPFTPQVRVPADQYHAYFEFQIAANYTG